MKYLVTLSPRGKFFFGGDRTFTSQKRQNYYARSTYFPQQTAILGMLRYMLLCENGLEEVSPQGEKGLGLIGKNGFEHFVAQEEKKDRGGKKEAVCFGIIKKISPVFIREGDTSWVPAGLDTQKYNEGILQLQPNEAFDLMQKFDYKKWIAPRMRDASNSGISQSLDSFFCKVSQVGNQKDRSGKTQEDGFFKRDYYSFKRETNYENRFSFAFELETTEKLTLEKVVSVSLGAESVFNISVAPLAQSIFYEIDEEGNKEISKRQKGHHGFKVTLLSDSYIKDLAALKKLARFILSDSPTPFRFNEQQKQDFYKEPIRSNAFQLLCRGTVIYTEKDPLPLIKLLDQNEAFRAIGYNHYQIETI